VTPSPKNEISDQDSEEVLFVSHDSGRTGAPFILLNFQRWLKENTTLKFATILRRAGPLEPEFAKLGKTFLIEPPAKSRSLPIRIANRLGWSTSSVDERLIALHNRSYRLLYSNTITNGEVLEALARPGVQVITHVHELDYWTKKSGPTNWKQVCRHTTKFVAVSEAVALYLQEQHGIARERIKVIHEFIPTQACTKLGIPRQTAVTRAQLGIPENAFVVGGSGSETWRKGKDLFVKLAGILRHRHPAQPFWFIWVGWQGNEEERSQLARETATAGVADSLIWTGEVANPLDYFAHFDAFALVSREDPFPLVCLEAALLEKPILCFAGTGGTPELIEQDSGFVVPNLDLEAMADKLIFLQQHKDVARRMGACGATKVRERFSLDVLAPRLYQLINDLLGHDTGVGRMRMSNAKTVATSLT
jgi:glycosyltransferase involved in cell wall biosynthesis